MPFGWNACCCGTCWSFSDDFERPDSTTIGTHWHEIDGDWEIKSGHLYVLGDGDTEPHIRYDDLAPFGDPPCDLAASYTRVKFRTDDPNLKIRFMGTASHVSCDFGAGTIKGTSFTNDACSHAFATNTYYVIEIYRQRYYTTKVYIDGVCRAVLYDGGPVNSPIAIEVKSLADGKSVEIDEVEGIVECDPTDLSAFPECLSEPMFKCMWPRVVSPPEQIRVDLTTAAGHLGWCDCAEADGTYYLQRVPPCSWELKNLTLPCNLGDMISLAHGVMTIVLKIETEGVGTNYFFSWPSCPDPRCEGVDLIGGPSGLCAVSVKVWHP